MSDYPVQVDVTFPQQFERIRLLLRFLLAAVLGWAGVTVGWIATALYFALPLLAAFTLSASKDFMPRVWRGVVWLLQFWAFMSLLTDRFPTDADVEIRIHPTGKPTVGSALVRLLTSIPSGIVLGLLWFVSGIVWMIGAVFILFTRRVPTSLLGYQAGVLRWEARLVAYHASLVDEYPPFSFDTEAHRQVPAAA